MTTLTIPILTCINMYSQNFLRYSDKPYCVLWEALDRLQKQMKQKVVIYDHPNLPERIYLRRGENARKPINEMEIETILVEIVG